jgi:hypothetical protein
MITARSIPSNPPPGLSGMVFEKILEEKHAMHGQIFHQEKSFQDLL